MQIHNLTCIKIGNPHCINDKSPINGWNVILIMQEVTS